MRPVLPLLLLAACHSATRDELADLDVTVIDLFDDPGEGVVYDLDASSDPSLVFTGFGMLGQEQYGTWTAWNVRSVVPVGGGLDGLRVSVVVDTTSVDTGNSSMTHHLLTDDFFDAERWPEARFDGVATEEAPGNFRVTGTLTVRGTTREHAYDAAIALEDGALVSSAHMELSRWDFGLYPANADEPGDDGVGDDVLLDYAVRLLPDGGP